MTSLLEQADSYVLAAVLILCIWGLSKATDILVDEAISISLESGISELVIGATIVSLGTSLPELAVSVLSAFKGASIVALGNIIGSTIVNTSFILGIGALYGSIPVNRKTANKHTVLAGLSLFLILSSLPVFYSDGQGRIPQWLGVLFLFLSPLYFIWMLREGKQQNPDIDAIASDQEKGKPLLIKLLKLLASAGFVIASASVMVTTVEIGAVRIGIPDSIIASTVVAFGTGLPEISTTIVSVKKGYGALAMGNIMGSNLLNTLLILGTAISLTPGGIVVSQDFYRVHFPALSILLAVLGYFSYNNKRDVISRKEGRILVVFYLVYLIWNYFF
ncbi:sodium:calcium antiporter [Trichococcus ilyis]|uniref:Cation:H+ antiporter n=1 Tax=Trichococcus ilyis TaxID=640938 RepID=A0A143Z5G9_9LACT|nr:sodium:calcium antiporter [Trichococcus ilyis]CZR08282.1 sodium/calcium exchanger membrane region [Trichococcus ilyis]SEJ75972.1 cation:H+ antiporter [Trichococcus ilyis]